MKSVKLYTRVNCHLCDQAYEVLTRNGLLPESIDIDADEELREKFTECVPVVEIDGRVRFRGIVNEVLLKRLLDGTQS